MNMTLLKARLTRAALAATALSAVAGCADKEFTVGKAALSPRIALQITATGLPASQVAASPLFLLTGAVYAVTPNSSDPGGDDMRILAFRWTRVVQGTQQITLPVDIAPCLADPTRLGSKDGCSLYVAAIVTPDSFDVASDTGDADPMMHALDYAFPVGPFDVVPGRTPVIPPIDLSLSRFGVVNWQQDDALRLGGKVNPNNTSGVLGGLSPITGVASGTAPPVIFSLSRGGTLVAPTTPNQPFPNESYPQLQIFENGAWRRVVATTAGTTTNFMDVTAFSTNEAYIAANSGLYRYDGAGISRVTAVTDSLYSIARATAGAAKYVIAGGNNGAVWIGNTTTWQRYVLPVNARIDGVCITGPAEAWASSSFNGAALFRFDGTTWTSVAASAPSSAGKLDLQCPAPGQAFVLTQSGPLLKWTATGWSQMPTTGLGPGRLIRWGVVSASEIYAWADSAGYDRAYYRFDGSSWQEIARTRFNQSASRPWADPRGGAAYTLMSFGRLERVTPSGRTVLSYQPALRDAVMTSASSAFVVGWNLFLARWDGAKWTVDPPPAGVNSTRVLQAVWSDGPGNAWAVGSGSTILRFSGSAWNVVSEFGKPVTSATESFNGVWGAGADVWIAGDAGITRCKTSGVGCALEHASAGMYGIWGSSASNIIAVGSGGKIVRFNGTSWSTMASPTSRLLVRLSGSSANDVWAVGDSVVVHFDGSQWSNVNLGGNPGYLRSRSPSPYQALFQIGIWARGPKEVYIGSDYGQIGRWDGQEWREVTPSGYFMRRIIAITGASGGCGLALTEGQSELQQPTLWRGIGSNGCLASPMTPPSVWP
jgi:hypothetical protein